MTNAHLWSGRFAETLDDAALAFSRSIELDGRMYREDIAGSIAHARMLGACGVLGGSEGGRIRAGRPRSHRRARGGGLPHVLRGAAA